MPFFAYATLFLILPALTVMVGAFKGNAGGYTVDNVTAIVRSSNLRDAFWESIRISLTTAVLGGLFGLLIAYAATRKGTPGWIRSAFGTFSGVAANFGGIPLAFAFIATLGTIGIVTQFLNNVFGVNIYEHGFAIWSRRGVELTYLYFQIPLMILVIAPAIDGLRAEWSEASANLGASSLPVLAPYRHAGADAVDPRRRDPALRELVRGLRHRLFADERDGAAARTDPDRQRPLGRRPLQPARGPGARLRNVRRPGGDDALLHPAAAACVAVGQVNRKRIAPSAVLWLVLGAVYFLVPLIATLLFSLRDAQTGKCCSLSAYGDILHDPQFWATIKVSFRLALETIAVGLLLFVPTIYWVHLKLPRLRPVVGFMALVPFVIPPIILVVGLLKFFKDTLHAPFWFLGKPDMFLVGAYVILSFPYIYFSLDAGFRVDRRAHADRGLARPRRLVAHDTRARDPAEHPGGGA